MLNIETYEEFGSSLKKMRNMLIHELTICESREKEKFKLLRKSLDRIDKVRSDLEDIMFIEHPKKGRLNIFYGPPQITIRD